MIEHVLFLRHFETRLNAEKRICGHSLTVPVLSTAKITWDAAVDAAFCSPAVRCVQTLDAFLPHSQIPLVVYDPALVERGMGVMEGQLRKDMAAAYPELFFGEKFHLYQTPPDGETFDAFHRRVDAFWKKINAEQNGTVLICSHNQFMKMLYLVIHELPVTEEEWGKLSFPHGVILDIG